MGDYESLLLARGVIRFVRSMGWEIGLDFDDDLLIDGGDIQEQEARRFLSQIKGHVVKALQLDRRKRMQQLVGGPLNGRRHLEYPKTLISVRVKRAEWHSYYVEDDCRARYIGKATSEKAARMAACEAIGWHDEVICGKVMRVANINHFVSWNEVPK